MTEYRTHLPKFAVKYSAQPEQFELGALLSETWKFRKRWWRAAASARIFAAAAAAGIGPVPQGPSQHIEILLSSQAPP